MGKKQREGRRSDARNARQVAGAGLDVQALRTELLRSGSLSPHSALHEVGDGLPALPLSAVDYIGRAAIDLAGVAARWAALLESAGHTLFAVQSTPGLRYLSRRMIGRTLYGPTADQQSKYHVAPATPAAETGEGLAVAILRAAFSDTERFDAVNAGKGLRVELGDVWACQSISYDRRSVVTVGVFVKEPVIPRQNPVCGRELRYFRESYAWNTREVTEVEEPYIALVTLESGADPRTFTTGALATALGECLPADARLSAVSLVERLPQPENP